MFLFESDKDKKTRKLIESQLQDCLNVDKKYVKSMGMIRSQIVNSNQKVIEQVVNRIKQIIKDQNAQPYNKYQAIRLLRDLMTTRNRALGNYVVKKILKRLTILAQYDKKSKTKKGKAIFGKVSQTQETYSIQFLNTLLLCLQQWGKSGQWPKDAKGPQAAFQEAYKELLVNKLVQFPKEDKSNSRSTSQPVQSQQALSKPKPGAKIQSMINNSLQQSSTLKPAQTKRAKVAPMSNQIKKYFTEVNDTLKTIIEILQASEQIDIEFIGSIIHDLIKKINQGDQLSAKLYEDPDANAKMIKKISETIQFSTELKKNYDSIKRNPNKIQSFRSDIVKKCRQIIANIVVYLEEKPQQVKKEKPTRSLTPTPKSQKPVQAKQQVTSPIVPEKNRYDSTQRFQLQFNNIDQIGNIQFRSGSSNRFGSINGPNAPVKQSRRDSEQKEQKEQNNSYQKESRQKIKPSSKTIKEQQQKPFSISQIKPSTSHQIDSKKVVKDSFQSPSQSNFQKNNEFSSNIDRKQPVENQAFAGFGQPLPKQEQSSSDFFNKIDNQQNQLPARRQPRRPAHQKNQPNDNFFDPSIKSNIDNSSYSGFSKSKKPSEEDNSKSKSRSNMPSKEQTESINRANESNFFGDFSNKVSNLQKKDKKDKNLFESVNNQFNDYQQNPMSFRKNNQNKPTNSKQDFFFDDPKQQSKIDIEVQKSERTRKASQNLNPNDYSSPQKSKKIEHGNPYDSDISKSFKGNPFDENQKSASDNKTPRSYVADNDNPFEEKTDRKPSAHQQDFKSFIKSVSSIKSEGNPYEENDIKNPFQEEPMKESLGFQIERVIPNQQFDLDDFDNFGGKPSSFRNSQKQSVKSGAFFDPNANKGSAVSKKSKTNEDNFFDQFGTKRSKQQSGFDLNDFDKFGASQQGEKRPSNEGFESEVRDRQSKKSKKQNSGFDFDQFDQPSNPFKKSNQNSREENNNSFDFVNGRQRQSGFDFDAFPGFNDSKIQKKPQEKPTQNLDFFGSQNKSNKVDLDYSKTEKDNVMPSENQFGTFSMSNQIQPNTQIKNYYQNEKSISSRHEKSQKQFDWGNFAQIKPSHEQIDKNFSNFENGFQKPGQYEISQSFESKKSNTENNIKQSVSKNQSQLSSGFQKKKKVGQGKIKQKSRQQSQKSVKLQDFMPIKKIGTPWNPIPNFSKKPLMYNINAQDVQKKRQQLTAIREKCKYEQQIFLSLKRKQAKNKQDYLDALNKISDIKTEKEEYQLILNKLKENNDIKEAEIHNINTRYQKIQEIRNKILQKEKLLFEKMKLQNSRKQSKPKQTRATAYKWEIFNRNLQNFRNNTMTMSHATKSYYA